MLFEEEGVELRGWCTVSVAALRAPSSAAPHLLQNSLPWGGAAEHDGQSLNWLSFPAELFIGADCFRDCTTELSCEQAHDGQHGGRAGYTPQFGLNQPSELKQPIMFSLVAVRQPTPSIFFACTAVSLAAAATEALFRSWASFSWTSFNLTESFYRLYI